MLSQSLRSSLNPKPMLLRGPSYDLMAATMSLRGQDASVILTVWFLATHQALNPKSSPASALDKAHLMAATKASLRGQEASVTRTSGFRQLCPALCTRPDTISSAWLSMSAGDQGPGTMIMGVTEPSSAVTCLLHGGRLPGTCTVISRVECPYAETVARREW